MQNFTAQFKERLMTFRHSSKKSGESLERDWSILFGMTALFVLLAAGLGIYLFSNVSRGEGRGAGGERAQLETLDRTALLRAIDTLEAQKANFEDVKRQRPGISDPSL